MQISHRKLSVILECWLCFSHILVQCELNAGGG